MPAALGIAQLAHCLRFDLTNSFAGEIEILADVFERTFSSFPDTESHAQDLSLARGERGQ